MGNLPETKVLNKRVYVQNNRLFADIDLRITAEIPANIDLANLFKVANVDDELVSYMPLSRMWEILNDQCSVEAVHDFILSLENSQNPDLKHGMKEIQNHFFGAYLIKARGNTRQIYNKLSTRARLARGLIEKEKHRKFMSWGARKSANVVYYLEPEKPEDTTVYGTVAPTITQKKY